MLTRRIILLVLLIAATAALSAPRRAPRLPNPGLGQFSAPVTFDVTVGGVAYRWTGSLLFTSVGTETRRSLSGTGSFLPIGPPPPPPLVPVLESLALPAASVGGATGQGTVNLSAVTTAAISIGLSSSNPALTVPATVTVAAGSRAAMFAFTTTGVFTDTAVTVTAQSGAISRTAVLIVLGGTPPPVTAALESLDMPFTVQSPYGGSGSVTFTAAVPSPVTVLLTTSNPILVIPTSLFVAAGQKTVMFNYNILAVTANTAVTMTATAGGVSKSVPILVTPPVVPPVGEKLNVRNYGAKGDGTTQDRWAIQAAVDASKPGQTIWFPAGQYLLNDAVKLYGKSGIGFVGDPPTQDAAGKWVYPSVLVHGGNALGLKLGNGTPFTGVWVRYLSFYGAPGKYMSDGNSFDSIQIHGGKGTEITDCYFRGVGRAVDNVGSIGGTYGTIVRRCQVDGWGVNAIFCNGGDRVEDVDLIQDDPNLYGARSSHGAYIHSGASNVTFDGVRISNVRKYAAQVYGEDENTFTDGVVLRNITIKNCANGLIVSSSQLSAARPRNLVIDGVIAENIYDSSGAIVVHTLDGGTIKNVTVRGVTRGSGLKLGDWPPYLPGMNIKNLTVSNINVTGAANGPVLVNGVNGGTFSNVSISGVVSGGVRLQGNTSGVTVVSGPGRGRPVR